MTVTALHSSGFLILRCGPEFGALMVEPPSARSGKIVDNLMMPCTELAWLGRKGFG